jgi:hypothetical protein
MIKNYLIAIIIVICYTRPVTAQVDQNLAQEYFKEAKTLCDRDSGRLWGVSICAPMIIADPRTHTFATSQPLPDSPRPKVVGFVNAPFTWAGTTWIAYTWQDLSTAPPWRRKEIMLHEMFHGVQKQLGVGVGVLENEHLDEVEGRYWMQLEWRALAQALKTTGSERISAIRDALAFRQQRRTKYPAARENERGLEINEGTASYTGTVLAASSHADAIANALVVLTPADINASFVRTFAYSSGPAYGILLDDASPGWPRRLHASDDLGTILMNTLAIKPSKDASAAAAKYGGADLLVAEQQRNRLRQDRITDLRRQFVDGPVLILPGGGSIASDSHDATVIPGAGTIYFHPYTAKGPWGKLTAEKGVLLSSDGQTRSLPAPIRRDDGTVSGDGWTFTPAPGWTIREAPRKGDLTVVTQQ